MVLKAVDIRVETDIAIEFRPDSADGLLFYSSQHDSEFSGDFISVSLADTRLQIRLSMGHEMLFIMTSLSSAILGLLI